MNTANDEGQSKQAYEEVVECVGIAKKKRQEGVELLSALRLYRNGRYPSSGFT